MEGRKKGRKKQRGMSDDGQRSIRIGVLSQNASPSHALSLA